MKTIFNIFKFLALFCWILLAGAVQASITLTNPNWTPVNYLISANPLCGPSKKSIANNVAYRWFDKNVWRSKPVTFTEGVSATREIQKVWFAYCQAYVKQMLSIINVGYKQQATKMPAYNVFMKECLLNFGYGYPTPDRIDYDKVIFAKGTLRRPPDLLMHAAAGKEFHIDWTNDAGQGNALSTDKLYFVFFDNDAGTWNPIGYTGVTRSVGHYTHVYAAGSGGFPARLWCFFASANGQLVSDSLKATNVTMIG